MSATDHEFEIRELHARQEAEALGVIGRNGKVDHGFNSLLRECFARNKHTGEIHWQETLLLRKKLIAGYQREQERG
jgi:hypothetical protein